MTTPFRELSVLVVEDEVIIGMMLCSEIARGGGLPIGPVTSVADALSEIESRVVDVAIVDAKLVDGSAEDLTARLEQRGIPYVVISGYEKAALPPRLRGAPFVAKPVSLPFLMEAVAAVAPASGRGAAGAIAGALSKPAVSRT